VAWFATSNEAINKTAGKVWRSAFFPSYPIEARQLREQGTVRLKVTIGKNGNVEQVQVLQTSGHHILDDAAVRAVQSWKAQPQYAGRTVVFPVHFSFRRH
jgi:protein TonB